MNDENKNDESKKDFLLGVIMGQIAELLNQISTTNIKKLEIYRSLLDIHTGSALLLHKIYYGYYSKEVKNDK